MSATNRLLLFFTLLGMGLIIWYAQGAWQLKRLEQQRTEIQKQFLQIKADIYATENSPQLWAHRGYHREGAAENSLEALDAAIDRGFPGVELDVFWGPPLVVQRSIPDEESLSSGDYDLLQSFYDASPENLYFYLDLKNLNEANANEIASALQEIFNLDRQRRCRSFVESRDAVSLARLRVGIPGVRTLYWISDYRNPVEVQSAVLASGTGAVSAPAIIMDQEFLSDFSHLRVHAFTENLPQYIDELVAGGVDVILTDSDLSADFPHMMSPTDRSTPE